MRSWKSPLSGICLLTVLLSWTLHAATTGPIAIGNWTLDVANSKYEPGPAPTSGERDYTDAGHGLMAVTVKTVYGDGRTTNGAATFAYDGSHHPVKGNPDYDEVATKRTGQYTTRSELIRGGQIIGHLTTTISRDRATLVTDYVFTNRSGQKVHNRAVWHRQ